VKNYVVCVMLGDYGEMLELVSLTADNIEEAKVKALTGKDSDAYVSHVIDGVIVWSD
jgi:hypothetical protein